MAQFGSREDAAWLLSLAVPADIQIDQLETAVLIEMRLGILADGATLPASRDHLATSAAGDRTLHPGGDPTGSRGGAARSARGCANACRSAAGVGDRGRH